MDKLIFFCTKEELLSVLSKRKKWRIGYRLIFNAESSKSASHIAEKGGV